MSCLCGSILFSSCRHFGCVVGLSYFDAVSPELQESLIMSQWNQICSGINMYLVLEFDMVKIYFAKGNFARWSWWLVDVAGFFSFGSSLIHGCLLSVMVKFDPWLFVVVQFDPWLSVMVHFDPWLSVMVQLAPWLSLVLQFDPWSSVMVQFDPWLSAVQLFVYINSLFGHAYLTPYPSFWAPLCML